MREKEEGRGQSLRRMIGEENHKLEEHEDSLPIEAQSPDTLREGYSWIRALQSQHPGWQPSAVEGFPFTLPIKPVSEMCVCLVSFAGVYHTGQKPFNISPGPVPPQLRAMQFRDRGDWSMREIAADCPTDDLMIAHAHYDHSEADEDINCVFPLLRLAEAEVEDLVGACAAVHYSLMGYVPEVELIVRTAAQEIIPRLTSQGVDGVVVSGGCELSHQSAALVQREIEAAGIPTVGISVCHDITYQLQVPRALSLRFPLGNPFGPSLDPSMQTRILKDALSLLETAKTPGDIVVQPYEWTKT